MNQGVAQLPMHQNHCEIGGHYFRTFYVPRVETVVNINKAIPKTWFESGHLCVDVLA